MYYRLIFVGFNVKVFIEQSSDFGDFRNPFLH